MHTENAKIPIRAESASRPYISIPIEKQREIFNLHRANGESVSASAKAAGISRRTGSSWERSRIGGLAELNRRKASLATKTELGEVYTSLLRDSQVDPRDKVAAGKAYAELTGLNEPTRTHATTIVVHSTVQQWIDAQRQAAKRIGESGETHMQIEAGGEPPIEAQAEAVSRPQIISKNPESGSDAQAARL